MGRNLTNLFVSESFQYLLQRSGSEVTDGLGVDVDSLNITSSIALDGFTNASYNEGTSTLTFTKGDGSTQGVVISVSASVSQSVSSSYSEFATSASYAIQSTNAVFATTSTSASFASNASTANSAISAASATSASFATSASYAVSASFEITKEVSSSFADFATSSSHAELADNATSASFATTASYVGFVDNALYSQNTITTGKNLELTTIQKGTPLFFTGSGTSGNIVGVYAADAGNPNRMPAGGIAGEDLASEAEGVVLLDGYIGNVNTTAFNSGDKIYVAVGGGYTNVRPTGSGNAVQFLGNVEKKGVNGSGVIQMMGEARNLPNLTQNYLWRGDSNDVPQEVLESTLSVASAVSSSQAENSNKLGQQPASAYATTGSNTFTGDQSFTNITVSGTGSFAYLQSVTGSAKVIGDEFLILNADSPTSRYAGIKVYDSGSTPISTGSFIWDSVNNDWFYQYEKDATDYAVALFGPEYGTIGTPIYPQANVLQKGTGGHHLTGSIVEAYADRVFLSGSIATVASASIEETVKITAAKEKGVRNVFIGEAFDETASTAGNSFSNVVIGSNLLGGSAPSGDRKHQNVVIGRTSMPSVQLSQDNVVIGTANLQYLQNGRFNLALGSFALQAFGFSNTNEMNYNVGIGYAAGATAVGGIGAITSGSNNVYIGALTEGSSPDVNNEVVIGTDATGRGSNTVTIGKFGSHTDTYINSNLESFGNLTVSGSSFLKGNTEVTGSLNVSNGIDVQGQVIGGVSALSIASQTASMDASTGNFFTLTLVSGSDTHLDASNITAGQTINLRVTNAGTGPGTLSFSPDFAFAEGTAPTVTAATSSVDILTFVSFDGTTLNGTSVLNLS